MSVIDDVNDKSYPKFLKKFEKSFVSNKTCENNFLKGCKWSPDGKCLLVPSEDFRLRLFEVSDDCIDKLEEVEEEENPVLEYHEGGTVYDFAWYPGMDSADPVSCVFASSSRDAPIHLWDAYTGGLRATYQPINQYDEVHSAYSICFSPSGKIYCGFKKQIKVFDLILPGRVSETICMKDKLQTGIISSIAFNPALSTLFAVGSYDKSIGLYTEPDGELQCLIHTHGGGLTQLKFSPDGTRLYSGGRQNDNLFCWDLRNPGSLLFSAKREVKTSQRIYFDLTPDGRQLYTGSTDGSVICFDTSHSPDDKGFLNPTTSWCAHQDCTNGVSITPSGRLLATASGQRHVQNNLFEEEEENEKVAVENCVKIWELPSSTNKKDIENEETTNCSLLENQS